MSAFFCWLSSSLRSSQTLFPSTISSGKGREEGERKGMHGDWSRDWEKQGKHCINELEAGVKLGKEG